MQTYTYESGSLQRAQFQPPKIGVVALSPTFKGWPTRADTWAVAALVPPRDWARANLATAHTFKNQLLKHLRSPAAGGGFVQRRTETRIHTYYADAERESLAWLQQRGFPIRARAFFARILSGSRVTLGGYSKEQLADMCGDIYASEVYTHLVSQHGDTNLALPLARHETSAF